MSTDLETQNATHSKLEQEPSRSKRPRSQRTLLRILTPVAVMVLAMVGLCSVFVALNVSNEIVAESQEAFDRAASEFRSQWTAEAAVMDTALDLICADPTLAKALTSGDGTAMQDRAAPLLKRLRDDHRIVRIQFHPAEVRRREGSADNSGVPEDKEDRQPSSTLELDHSGALMVVTIRPIHDDGRLAGHVKFAQEIEHVTRRLKASQGMEFAIAVNKEFIDRDTWNKSAESHSRRVDWDQSAASVILYETIPEVPEEVITHLDDESREPDNIRVSAGNRVYRATLRRLHDSSGRRIARIVIMRDVTAASASLWRTVKHVSIACGGIGLAAIVFLYLLVIRVKRSGEEQSFDSPRTGKTQSTVKVEFVADKHDLEPSVRTAPAAGKAAQRSRRPVRSEFADDPDMTEIIDDFVKRLGDFVEDMSRALDSSSFEELRRLSHQLKGAGGGYGYQSLTEAARTLENAAKIQDPETARLAMNELNELCKAIAVGWKTADLAQEIA